MLQGNNVVYVDDDDDGADDADDGVFDNVNVGNNVVHMML